MIEIDIVQRICNCEATRLVTIQQMEVGQPLAKFQSSTSTIAHARIPVLTAMFSTHSLKDCVRVRTSTVTCD